MREVCRHSLPQMRLLAGELDAVAAGKSLADLDVLCAAIAGCFGDAKARTGTQKLAEQLTSAARGGRVDPAAEKRAARKQIAAALKGR